MVCTYLIVAPYSAAVWFTLHNFMVTICYRGNLPYKRHANWAYGRIKLFKIIIVTAVAADVWGCGKDPNAGTDIDAESELNLVR